MKHKIHRKAGLETPKIHLAPVVWVKHKIRRKEDHAAVQPAEHLPRADRSEPEVSAKHKIHRKAEHRVSVERQE